MHIVEINYHRGIRNHANIFVLFLFLVCLFNREQEMCKYRGGKTLGTDPGHEIESIAVPLLSKSRVFVSFTHLPQSLALQKQSWSWHEEKVDIKEQKGKNSIALMMLNSSCSALSVVVHNPPRGCEMKQNISNFFYVLFQRQINQNTFMYSMGIIIPHYTGEGVTPR